MCPEAHGQSSQAQFYLFIFLNSDVIFVVAFVELLRFSVNLFLLQFYIYILLGAK